MSKVQSTLLCLLVLVGVIHAALQFDCSMASKTSAAKIDALTSRLLPELQSCEESLFASADCDVYWSKAHVLLLHEHSRACEIENFKNESMKIIRRDGNKNKEGFQAALDELGVIKDAIIDSASSSSTLASKLETKFNDFVTTMTTTVQNNLIDELDEAKFWSDNEREGHLNDLTTSINTGYDDVEDTWDTFLSTSISSIRNTLLSGSGTNLETRALSTISDLKDQLENALDEVLSITNEEVKASRSLWMEFSLARKNQRPANIQFAYPSSASETGYLPEVIELLRERKAHVAELGYTVSPSFDIQMDTGESAVASGTYSSAWYSFSSAYEVLVNAIQ